MYKQLEIQMVLGLGDWEEKKNKPENLSRSKGGTSIAYQRGCFRMPTLERGGNKHKRKKADQ